MVPLVGSLGGKEAWPLDGPSGRQSSGEGGVAIGWSLSKGM